MREALAPGARSHPKRRCRRGEEEETTRLICAGTCRAKRSGGGGRSVSGWSGGDEQGVQGKRVAGDGSDERWRVENARPTEADEGSKTLEFCFRGNSSCAIKKDRNDLCV